MSTYLNTRDLAKRKEELEGFRDTLLECKEALAESEDTDGESSADVERAEIDFGPEEQEELAELETLENEISEWRYGEMLIHEDSFTDYCREMLADCGDIPTNLPAYIENNINWDGVADDLRADYSEVEYQGATYLVRS